MNEKKRTRAIGLIEAARARAEDHFSGTRDLALDSTFDDQIRRFIHELEEMEKILQSGDEFGYQPSIGRVITDGWPFSSSLGELLLAACQAYTEAT